MRRGIILAGGNGTRLHPLTAAVSKQLLPVYDRPMVLHTVDRMRGLGVTDILCIVAPRDVEAFRRVLGPAINVVVQPEPRGIAEALLIADTTDPVLLWLGDNLVLGPEVKTRLVEADHRTEGATVFTYPVADPRAYGVAQVRRGRVVSIEEKPLSPKSRLAVAGVYFYDGEARDRAKALRPSPRGELEITDLNRSYLMDGKLHALTFGARARWFDMGTVDDLLDAGQAVRRQNP